MRLLCGEPFCQRRAELVGDLVLTKRRRAGLIAQTEHTRPHAGQTLGEAGHLRREARRDHQDGAVGLFAAPQLFRRALVLVGALPIRARGQPELPLDDCWAPHDDRDVRGRVGPLDGPA